MKIPKAYALVKINEPYEPGNSLHLTLAVGYDIYLHWYQRNDFHDYQIVEFSYPSGEIPDDAYYRVSIKIKADKPFGFSHPQPVIFHPAARPSFSVEDCVWWPTNEMVTMTIPEILQKYPGAAVINSVDWYDFTPDGWLLNYVATSSMWPTIQKFYFFTNMAFQKYNVYFGDSANPPLVQTILPQQGENCLTGRQDIIFNNDFGHDGKTYYCKIEAFSKESSATFITSRSNLSYPIIFIYSSQEEQSLPTSIDLDYHENYVEYGGADIVDIYLKDQQTYEEKFLYRTNIREDEPPDGNILIPVDINALENNVVKYGGKYDMVVKIYWKGVKIYEYSEPHLWIKSAPMPTPINPPNGAEDFSEFPPLFYWECEGDPDEYWLYLRQRPVFGGGLEEQHRRVVITRPGPKELFYTPTWWQSPYQLQDLFTRWPQPSTTYIWKVIAVWHSYVDYGDNGGGDGGGGGDE